MVKILLLEDNAIDAFIAQKVVMLSGAEARLDVVDGAAQALDLITNQYVDNHELPDFILVDQFMPFTDGLQFLDAFAALDMPGKERITILMLTNSIDPHVSAEAIRRGAHGIISKPISVPILVEMIAHAQPKDPLFLRDPAN